MALQQIRIAGVPRVDEDFTASESITAGHLIEKHVGAGVQLRKHSTAAANGLAYFALEREEIGNDPSETVYTSGVIVKAGLFKKGDKVLARIATGQDLDGTEFLESAGDGTLRALAADAATDETQRESVIAQSDENTGGAVGAETFHKVIIQ